MSARLTLWVVLAVALLVFCLPAGCGSRESGESSPGEISPSPSPHETPEPPAEPSPSPDPLPAGCLAFLRRGDLWALTPGGEEIRLTAHGLIHRFLWSPRGDRIACFAEGPQHSGQLLLVDPGAPGAEPAVFDTGWILFEWSPDGSRLACGLSAEPLIRIYPVDGGAPLELRTPGAVGDAPQWHPGADLLAYTVTFPGGKPEVILQEAGGAVRARIPGAMAPCWYDGGRRLAVIRVEVSAISDYWFYVETGSVDDRGGDYRVLSNRPVRGIPLRKLSPDGRTLVLADYTSLFARDLHGEREALLLEQDLFMTFSEFSYPVYCAWNPDSRRLVALRYTHTAEIEWTGTVGVEGYWDLVTVDWDNGEVALLWPEVYHVGAGDAPPLHIWDPLLWAPQPWEVLLPVLRPEGGYDLWSVPAGGGPPRLLLEDAAYPALRP